MGVFLQKNLNSQEFLCMGCLKILLIKGKKHRLGGGGAKAPPPPLEKRELPLNRHFNFEFIEGLLSYSWMCFERLINAHLEIQHSTQVVCKNIHIKIIIFFASTPYIICFFAYFPHISPFFPYPNFSPIFLPV